ncbi:DNA-binding response regulator, NarL/FixJ family, contains REC and HTH domains [Afifella marina DSM 2698]|uniref:DNA-binding response regulator, NarL/FixJ family, contains REC and HTH domains n=1 Tax=Afifella marina DSM 2698 TaxID=1120955 RepID=A0A1G5P548_AFIMA|nr:response regulator transcription factor [Afifella marina]SCZ44665.1 DNA-binding response regulator, NarL/FixJ family, contains REC and HTH domains [Afifella marina DSM 2698]
MQAAAKSYRIGVVDDHPCVIAGIRAALEFEEGLVFSGEARTAEQALALAESGTIDALVADLSLPGAAEGAWLPEAIARAPSLPVLAYTMHADTRILQRVFALGVTGYVLKSSEARHLIDALRLVLSGRRYIDPCLATQLLPCVNEGENDSEETEITRREEETLKLTAFGFSIKEIAGKLCVSPKSVETYKRRAAQKLSLQSRADIVRFAIDRGWLDIDRPPLSALDRKPNAWIADTSRTSASHRGRSIF